MAKKPVPAPDAEIDSGIADLMLAGRAGKMRLSQVIPWDGNPRDHDAEQVRLLQKSIRAHGFINPLLLQEGSNKMVAGHGRRIALLGMVQAGSDPEVPVVWAKLTDEQAAAYAVADNRLTDLSTWNLPALKAVIVDLDDGAFDLEAMGFTAEALAELFPELEEETLLPGTDPDDAPPLPAVAFSRQGDLWLLGRHRLLCGDSTVPDDVARLMDGARADLVLTDPPYGMDYSSNASGTAGGKIANDNLDRMALEEFLTKAFACMVVASKANAPWYVWHSYHRQREFQNALEMVGLKLKSQIIWVKPSAGLGMDEFRRRHKNAFVAGQEGQDIGLVVQEHGTGWFGYRLKQKPPVWLGERTQTTVWECGRDAGKDLVHPTQKPVSLLLKAMGLSTRPKNLVLDLFGGSGSTLMACEVAGRSACLLELDERFVDVIVRRWENATGRKATLLRGGKELPAALPGVDGA